jgi:DNA mismatch repair protein MutS
MVDVDTATLTCGSTSALDTIYTELEELEEQRSILQTQLQQHFSMFYGDALTDVEASSLRLAHYPSLGHVIDVAPKDAAKMEAELDVIQTLRGKHRFRHKEWTAMGERKELMQQLAKDEEARVMQSLVDTIVASSDEVVGCAKALAEVDVATALATLAREHNYVRPTITEE